MPAAMKPEASHALLRPANARDSLSRRTREINRRNIATAPAIHMTASTTAVQPCVIFHMGSPMAPSGVAQAKCGAHSLSITAPVGPMKLSAVTTQIQYFVVELAPELKSAPMLRRPQSMHIGGGR